MLICMQKEMYVVETNEYQCVNFRYVRNFIKTGLLEYNYSLSF